MSDITIYGLTDRDGKIRYVGCTSTPISLRRARHIWQARCNQGACERYVSRWIRSVGYDITIVALEIRPKDHRQAEREWITTLRSQGCQLTNLTCGGEGAPPRGFLLSLEQRLKISEANRRRWSNPQNRERLAESNRLGTTGIRGRHHTPDAKAKISAAQKGIPKGSPSEETRLRMSESAKRRGVRERGEAL